MPRWPWKRLMGSRETVLSNVYIQEHHRKYLSKFHKPNTMLWKTIWKICYMIVLFYFCIYILFLKKQLKRLYDALSKCDAPTWTLWRYFFTVFRSIRSQMFFKIGALKNFANFTGKHLRRSSILIALQAFRFASLLKRDSSTGAFLWNFLRIPFFTEHIHCLLLCYEKHLMLV